jgi:hypothetical protein
MKGETKGHAELVRIPGRAFQLTNLRRRFYSLALAVISFRSGPRANAALFSFTNASSDATHRAISSTPFVALHVVATRNLGVPCEA